MRNLITALLVSFAAVALAKPVVDGAAREASVEWRSCQTVPFLVCSGSVDQEFACANLGFNCPGNGLSPVISDPTCAAQCVCEIPCP
ncbi:hypothetical protein B0H19DRAFT_1385376 [Mycena capillaripes]|nr:hypothetical protein B0H19DRAFT_1204173 [Mycena capillaripes]KAJ6527755.1 hypothetical protein B0H19DRAFT_1385376 [Mycena capillaripes]